jgi:hypothetical protein
VKGGEDLQAAAAALTQQECLRLLEEPSRTINMSTRVADPGGEKRPAKVAKVKKFHVLMWSMFSFESFFCNLDVLYGGLGIGKL